MDRVHLMWSQEGRLLQPCIYIMSNHSMTLYTGVTSDLPARVGQHRSGEVPAFTQQYHCDRLVFFESFSSMEEAIRREKQIKGWRREKKIALIKKTNPEWRDLAADWESRRPEARSDE